MIDDPFTQRLCSHSDSNWNSLGTRHIAFYGENDQQRNSFRVWNAFELGIIRDNWKTLERNLARFNQFTCQIYVRYVFSEEFCHS